MIAALTEATYILFRWNRHILYVDVCEFVQHATVQTGARTIKISKIKIELVPTLFSIDLLMLTHMFPFNI